MGNRYFGWGGTWRSAAFVLALAALVGCDSDLVEYSYPETRGGGEEAVPVYSKDPREPGLFGNDGLVLFGSGDEGGERNVAPGSPGVAVNSFLWRASLDTISFMPLSSADPFGGVIITDWYSPPETPDERFKMNVYILGRQLRSDGIRVSIFRQTRDIEGHWTNVPVSASTNTSMENQILTRARQLRIATASN